MIRLVLVDDHVLLRDTLRARFDAQPGYEVVGEASDGREAIAVVAATMPDVVLMDLSMPVMDGATATEEIHRRYPQVKVVVLTMHEDKSTTLRALRAGAVRLVWKGCRFDDVARAVREAEAGYIQMSVGLADMLLRETEQAAADKITPRQRQILQALVTHDGETKKVAADLGISVKTLHNHLNAIYRALDTTNAMATIVHATRLGLIDLYDGGAPPPVRLRAERTA